MRVALSPILPAQCVLLGNSASRNLVLSRVVRLAGHVESMCAQWRSSWTECGRIGPLAILHRPRSIARRFSLGSLFCALAVVTPNGVPFAPFGIWWFGAAINVRSNGRRNVS